jgi:hypothetical protein
MERKGHNDRRNSGETEGRSVSPLTGRSTHTVTPASRGKPASGRMTLGRDSLAKNSVSNAWLRLR